jgi:hypothetical protein
LAFSGGEESWVMEVDHHINQNKEQDHFSILPHGNVPIGLDVDYMLGCYNASWALYFVPFSSII